MFLKFLINLLDTRFQIIHYCTSVNLISCKTHQKGTSEKQLSITGCSLDKSAPEKDGENKELLTTSFVPVLQFPIFTFALCT